MLETKKTIKVHLDTAEIAHDVQNTTHLTGQAREAAGTNYREAAYMQASQDEEHAYKVLRSISNAIAHLKVELGEYLDENMNVSNNYISDAVEQGKFVTLTFKLPSNFNNSAVDSLGGGLHEYVVNRAVFDWFTVTNKADAPDYNVLAQASLERVKQALYKRARPTRPEHQTLPA